MFSVSGQEMQETREIRKERFGNKDLFMILSDGPDLEIPANHG